jgi:prevent-host-death family protein
MRQVNIHEAKTHLSRLIDDVAKGETIIIAKAGKPIGKLVTMLEEAKKPEKRKLGQLQGMYTIPDDFDTMFQKEIEEMFYGAESK